jgi:hypothetical protein
MSHWQRFHLDDTVKAIATSDNHRFFIQVREPPGEHRNPIEFFRWTLKEAQDAADRSCRLTIRMSVKRAVMFGGSWIKTLECGGLAPLF